MTPTWDDKYDWLCRITIGHQRDQRESLETRHTRLGFEWKEEFRIVSECPKLYSHHIPTTSIAAAALLGLRRSHFLRGKALRDLRLRQVPLGAELHRLATLQGPQPP